MYDEVEYFRDYNDDQFKYPYVPRKTILDSFTLTIPELGIGGPNYDIDVGKLKFG